MDHNPTISFLENCDCIKQLWWEEVKTLINFDHLPHFEHIVHDTTFTIYGKCTPGKLSYNMFYLEPWYMWLDQLFELDPIVGLYERWRALLYDWKASVVIFNELCPLSNALGDSLHGHLTKKNCNNCIGGFQC